ncbi:MAG: hypothetical protein NC299_18240 [Lachnospiraceae bacterium]|nr:hypothetical protein [Lachnospiraceae bacterium]
MIIHDCTNGELLDDIDKLEIETISKYKELGLAYNVQEGGKNGFHGLHLSEETKRKIGEKTE